MRPRRNGTVAKRETASLPQPPWVWGTSEAEEWLRASSSLRKPRKGRHREGPETVSHLAVELSTDDPSAVRHEIAKVSEEVGIRIAWTDARDSAGAPRHGALVGVRRSLFRTRVRVGFRFNPPIHPGSAEKILHGLAKRFTVTKVSAKETRVRLPPRDR